MNVFSSVPQARSWTFIHSWTGIRQDMSRPLSPWSVKVTSFRLNIIMSPTLAMTAFIFKISRQQHIPRNTGHMSCTEMWRAGTFTHRLAVVSTSSCYQAEMEFLLSGFAFWYKIASNVEYAGRGWTLDTGLFNRVSMIYFFIWYC